MIYNDDFGVTSEEQEEQFRKSSEYYKEYDIWEKDPDHYKFKYEREAEKRAKRNKNK